MFEIFPGNYVWNLAVNLALNTGGHIGEVTAACAPLIRASAAGDDAGTEFFFRSWCEVAGQLAGLAEEDEAAGHRRSAAARYGRASVYYLTAERMQSRHFGDRPVAYGHMLRTFGKSITLDEPLACRTVEVPYEDTSLPALFVHADDRPGPKPTMVLFNGLDSTKEMIYGSGIATELAARGISSLIVDHPGSGEALRLRGLTGIADSERFGSACVDFLAARPDVDPDRIGVLGWSLGGYYAPRAAAYEKRFALCVAWGANYDWRAVQRHRRALEGDRPVPHYWDHVQWVFGKNSVEEFLDFAEQMTLVGVVEEIRKPFLITHGSNDRQIPGKYAVAQYEAAVNSPKRELKWFTEREGGVEHVSADNMSVATAYIADWVGDTL